MFAGEINGKELTASRDTWGRRRNRRHVDRSPGGEHSARVLPDCETSEAYYDEVIESAICVGIEGIDGMWYELFADAEGVKKGIAKDVRDLNAIEDDCLDSVKGTATHEEYSQTIDGTEVASEWHKIVCYVNDDGAWISQADPYAYIIWTGLMDNGDMAELEKWWVANATILTYTEPR